MDEEDAKPDITTGHIRGQSQSETTSFHPTWQPSDAIQLQPSNLGRPKVLRAWERKPQSPFSRNRLRVGKVWKRPSAMTRFNIASGEEVPEGRSVKRRKASDSIRADLKPVKKLCLDSKFGMGATVVGWDGAESSVRKIVTRSTAGAEDIVALPDEEEPEAEDGAGDSGDATIEIVNEDGTTLLDPTGGEAIDGGWEDEAQDDDGHGTSLDESEAPAPSEDIRSTSVDEEACNEADVEGVDAESRTHDNAQNDVTDNTIALAETEHLGTTTNAAVKGSQDQTLPEGFVTPLRRRQATVQRHALLRTRRRTLPVQFAPSIPEPADLVAVSATVNTPVENGGTDTGPEVVTVLAELEESAIPDEPEVNVVQQGEDEWEDVESIDSVEERTNDNTRQPVAEPEGSASDDTQEQGDLGHNMDIDLATDETDGNTHEAEDPARPADEHDDSPVNTTPVKDHPLVCGHSIATKLPSSPIPTIEGQHARLPLRRSPRRKSTSPMKRSATLPSTTKPHHIAFTPLRPRGTLFATELAADPRFIEQTNEDQQDASSPFERPASAPPEEPCMSERKPTKPRISDDTALLQAFLNRAAESKGSRRMSASKRESMENRRDSDTIRNALASPAKSEVLADLDPNSPSPRKPAVSIANEKEAFDETATDAAVQAEDDTLMDEAAFGNTTRRSGRKKRAPPSTPGPNKISIRNNTDGVVIKRTEAQELAQLTRTNTKKNKGSAVMPKLRLTKIALQFGIADPDATMSDDSPVKKVEGAKGVRWAETLAQFWQGGEVSEINVSDELKELSRNAAPCEKSNDQSVTDSGILPMAPPPSETPSKPKIRRLKAPRTAAAPGNGSSTVDAPPPDAPAAVEDAAPAPTAKAPAATKRRSRIATPAKGLMSASLLPADLDPQPIVPATPAQQSTRIKRAAISKLPAPAPVALTGTTSLLGQGKENTLTSSPAKKRPAATSTANGLPSVRLFAPKLELGGKTRLDPAAKGEEGAVPVLLSPAKKCGRTRVVGLGKSDAGVSVGEERVVVKESVPGLSSPAKKRGRRAV